MTQLAQIASAFICLLYGGVLAGYALRFRRKGGAKESWVRWALVFTILAHLVYLLHLALRDAGSLINTSAGWLSALALGLTLVYALTEWISREKNMGLWVMGLPLIFQIISTFGIDPESGTSNPSESPLLVVHVTTVLIGYCALSLSAAFAVMYLTQYHQIKVRRLGLIFERLPSLETLENLGHRAINFGFGFLLVGLILGGWLLHQEAESLKVNYFDPKIVVVAFACAVYGLTILMRQRLSIQGKRFALVSIAGFGLILFSLLVVDAFFGGFHQF